jgi:hypothetical protein
LPFICKQQALLGYSPIISVGWSILQNKTLKIGIRNAGAEVMMNMKNYGDGLGNSFNRNAIKKELQALGVTFPIKSATDVEAELRDPQSPLSKMKFLEKSNNEQAFQFALDCAVHEYNKMIAAIDGKLNELEKLSELIDEREKECRGHLNRFPVEIDDEEIAELEKIQKELDEIRVEIKILMVSYESLKKEIVEDKKELEDMRKSHRLITVLRLKNEIEDMLIKSDEFGISRGERDALAKKYLSKIDNISEDKSKITPQDISDARALFFELRDELKSMVSDPVKESIESRTALRVEKMDTEFREFAVKEATKEASVILKQNKLASLDSQLSSLKGQEKMLETDLGLISNKDNKQDHSSQPKP